MQSPRRIAVVLLLLALSIPQAAFIVSGAAQPSAPDGSPALGTSAIEEGLSVGDTGEGVTALQDYLDTFGYLKGVVYADAVFDEATESALVELQVNFKLRTTGVVDKPTLKLIQTPRFDTIPDVAANGDAQVGEFVLYGTSWDDPNLTYAFDHFTNDLSQSAQKSAMVQALQAWSAVTPLVFTEVAMNQNPEIVISFESGNHGDGSSFDGPSGVLAHAFYPPYSDPSSPTLHGDAHFDDAETWTVTIPVPGGGIDLVTVAIHEFGHSLGLAHSNNSSAIMYAYYGGASRTLHSDDISGIQALYGSSGGGQTIDAQVVSIAMSPTSVQVGNNVTGTVQVRNNGSSAAAIPVTVTGPASFTYSTTTSSVNPGDTTSFNFNWTPASAGSFTLTATANLNGDSNSSNNSATSNTVTVTSPPQTVDAAVTSASASPTSLVQNSGNVTISAQIQNNGSAPATIPVTATGPNNWSSSTSRTLQGGASTSVQFSWPASVIGTHTFNVATSLGGDQVAGNNSQTTNTVTVTSPPETIDAEVVSASASPTSIQQNTGNVTITTQIRNNGGSPATIPVTATGPNNWSSSTSRTLQGGASTSVQFSWPASVVGTHTFNVATSLGGDQVSGNNSKATNGVSVTSPPAGNTVYVAGVNVTATPSGGGHALQAVITLGPNAAAGANATLYGYWISPQNQYQFAYGSTNGSGVATFQSTTSQTGTHQFLVSYVYKSGRTYNSSQNTGNPGTVNVGGGPQPTIDASVNNVSVNPTSLPFNSGNVTITATIGNNGDNPASIPVSISGPGGYSTSQNVSVGAGATQQVAFNWPASIVGNHTFAVSTNLSGDSNSGNNQRVSPSVSVTQVTVIDAEVVTLTRSTSSVVQNGPAVTFTANVRNNGTNSATFNVRLRSTSAGVNTAQQVTLASGASQSVDFQWNPSVVGNHSFTASTELTNDSVSGNNSKSVSLAVTSPPSGGPYVFVESIIAYRYGNTLLIYTRVSSSNQQVTSGAVVTGTVSAASGQSVQVTGTSAASRYTVMYLTAPGTGQITYTVNNISISGYTYNQALNSVTAINLPN